MTDKEQQVEAKKTKVYASMSPEWCARRFEGMESIEVVELETIKDMLSSNVGSHDRLILDIGCGTGRLVEMFPGEAFVGIDLSPAFIEYCRRHRQREKASFLLADLSHLPFKPGSFDIILLVGTFESEAHPAEKIAQFLVYLKPGGKILFTLQNSRNILARVANFFAQSYPKTYWSRRYLRRTFGSNDSFDCQLKTNFVMPPGILRTLFRKWIKQDKWRQMIVRPCLFLERLNLKYALNWGYEWKICLTLRRS